jgi:predicted metal-binding membrane protein
MNHAATDRWTTLGALLVVAALAWIYLVRLAAGMTAPAMAAMPGMAAMPDTRVWGAADVLGLFVMWTVMMAGMMLPSATPLVLLVVNTYRRRGGPLVRTLTAAFTAGYLLAWTAFSGVATALQVLLHRAALLTPMMASRSAWLGGGILVAAGIYQWLSLKDACLAHCRSPLHFLSHEWREGVSGALVMGLRHGWFCVGCCWALMALLFAVGAMNLVWVAAIGVFVLLEKVTRAARLVSRVAGIALIVWGAWILAGL